MYHLPSNHEKKTNLIILCDKIYSIAGGKHPNQYFRKLRFSVKALWHPNRHFINSCFLTQTSVNCVLLMYYIFISFFMRIKTMLALYMCTWHYNVNPQCMAVLWVRIRPYNNAACLTVLVNSQYMLDCTVSSQYKLDCAVNLQYKLDCTYLTI